MPLTETESKLLIALLDGEKMYITELQQKARVSRSAVYTAIRKLMERNLIVVEEMDRFPFQRFIKLTDRGKRIAELLVEIEKLLIKKS